MKRVRQNHMCAAVLCAFGLGAFGTAEAAIEVRADFNNDGFEDLAIGVPGDEIQDPEAGNPRAAGCRKRDLR